MQNDPKKYIKLKSVPFFGTNQSENAAAVLMLTYNDNQKATKAHCWLAFSAQPQRFVLPLLAGLHGSTDTTAGKSAVIEEKMFWKVTLMVMCMLSKVILKKENILADLVIWIITYKV